MEDVLQLTLSKQTINKYKLDYIGFTLLMGFIGFLTYEFILLPYLITKIPCESIVNNFDNNRFSLTNLQELIHYEYNQRCM